MLTCTGDVSTGRPGDEAELRGTVVLRFRSSLIRGWTLDHGLLLLHHTGKATTRVEVAAFDGELDEKAPPRREPAVKWIAAEVQPQAQGWSLVRVPGEALRALAADERRGLLVRLPRDWRVSSRESMRGAPYMFVEGSSANTR